MQPTEPSRTAKIAALGRGQHRILHAPPWLIDDPYALSLIGPSWKQLYTALCAVFPKPVREEAICGVAARSRYVEDVLAAGEFAQYVILGAGLDSFGWRRPDALRTLRVFEVDHPATQAWKRERAQVLALPRSARHVFAPVDFETEKLDIGLASVGFDPSAPTLFSLMGVVPYLTTDTIVATLRGLSGAATGSKVVLSYAVTIEFITDEIGRQFFELLLRVATGGDEPVLTFLSPTEAEDFVAQCGLKVVEHLDRDALRERYLAGRSDVPPPYSGERVITAAVP